MKKFIYVSLLFLSALGTSAQKVYNLPYDTVQLKEIKIINSSKTNVGPLYNLGNGKTGFKAIENSDLPPVSNITVLQQPAVNTVIPAGSSLDYILKALFAPPQNPTASLTYLSSSSYLYERVAAGSNLSITANWSGGRVAGTSTLASIVVNGVSQTFSQPAVGSSASGTVSLSFARNTSVSFQNVVTTTDAPPKSATATFTANCYDRRYAGFDANALVSGVPAQSDVLAATYQDNSGTSISLSQSTAQQGSNKYYFYITKGTVSSVTINGIPATAAFNLNIPITFTNASGGTYSGYANVSVNAFGANTGGNTIVFN